MIWTLIRINGWLSIAVNIMIFIGMVAAIIVGIMHLIKEEIER